MDIKIQEPIKEDFTTKEMSKLLGISEQTIYSLVKRGDIIPINKEDWTIDGTYYFDSNALDKVKEMYEKPGLTNKDVAEELQVSLSTAQKWIKSGRIPSFTSFYLGKDVSFVREEDLKIFMEQHQFERRTTLFHKGSNTFLFQKFVHTTTKEVARIIEITKEGEVFAVTERGTKLSFQDLTVQGYVPSTQIIEKKNNNKRGYAIFQFVQPSQLLSPIYEVIEMLVKNVGWNNMKVKWKEETIEVYIKPTLLPLNKEDHKTFIDLLQYNIKEGKVSVRHKGVMVDSDLETIHTVVPSHLKNKINQLVNKSDNLTIEEFVKMALENELKKRGLL